MDFPDESQMEKECFVSATLAAVRPGCISDGSVDFAK
jgi:hypothetical protein